MANRFGYREQVRISYRTCINYRLSRTSESQKITPLSSDSGRMRIHPTCALLQRLANSLSYDAALAIAVFEAIGLPERNCQNNLLGLGFTQRAHSCRDTSYFKTVFPGFPEEIACFNRYVERYIEINERLPVFNNFFHPAGMLALETIKCEIRKEVQNNSDPHFPIPLHANPTAQALYFPLIAYS